MMHICNILVIDDDNFFSYLACSFVKSRGHSATSCNTPALLDHGTLASYDLIFLDIMMPAIDGVQMLSVIKQYAPASDVILMTGVEEDVLNTIYRFAKEIGIRIRGALSKPFNSAKFMALLDNTSSKHTDELAIEHYGIVEIQQAFQTDCFFVELQPQVSLNNDNWVGCEGLARWQYAPGHVVMPSQFITIIENSTLAMDFTLRIIRRAITEMQKLIRATGKTLSLSINIPAPVLESSIFSDLLLEIVNETNFPPNQLILELTEHSQLLKLSYFLKNVSRLKLHHIRFSIDDIGTGYSALKRINDPIYDEFKIDHSFFQNPSLADSNKEIVIFLLKLAENLCITSVAEGIENYETYQWLRSNGCHIGQGYFISYPLGVDDLVEWHRGRT